MCREYMWIHQRHCGLGALTEDRWTTECSRSRAETMERSASRLIEMVSVATGTKPLIDFVVYRVRNADTAWRPQSRNQDGRHGNYHGRSNVDGDHVDRGLEDPDLKDEPAVRLRRAWKFIARA